jgi:hypothetical protein
VDLAVAAVVPLLTVWLYEFSNLAVLAAEGEQVSMTVEGWIPLGVAGVSVNALSPLTKLAQVLLATGLLIPLTVLVSRARLALARALILAMAGAFLASTYWELLSQLSMIPMAVHVSVYLAATATVSFALLRRFMSPRQLNNRLARPLT